MYIHEPLLERINWDAALLKPEIWHILLISVSSKWPPGMITYDRKQTIAQLSQNSV